MRHITSIITAAVIMISASVASADCTVRTGKGMFAHTAAPTAAVVKTVASSSAVKNAR